MGPDDKVHWLLFCRKWIWAHHSTHKSPLSLQVVEQVWFPNRLCGRFRNHCPKWQWRICLRRSIRIPEAEDCPVPEYFVLSFLCCCLLSQWMIFRSAGILWLKSLNQTVPGYTEKPCFRQSSLFRNLLLCSWSCILSGGSSARQCWFRSSKDVSMKDPIASCRHLMRNCWFCFPFRCCRYVPGQEYLYGK